MKRTQIRIEIRQERDGENNSVWSWFIYDLMSPVSSGRCSSYQNALLQVRTAIENYDAEQALNRRPAWARKESYG